MCTLCPKSLNRLFPLLPAAAAAEAEGQGIKGGSRTEAAEPKLLPEQKSSETAAAAAAEAESRGGKGESRTGGQAEAAAQTKIF